MRRVIIKIITKVLSTNFCIKLLYNVSLPKKKILFQAGLGTLQMKNALSKYVQENDKVLDLGIGPLAILSIWLKKRKKVEVTGSDLYDKFLINAKKNIELNKVNVKLIKSDLFENIKGHFDIIAFNPPFKNQKDEGSYKLVDMFLRTAPDSRLLMVGNPYYANLKKLEVIISKNKYNIENIVTSLFNPARIYVMKRE